MGFFDNSRVTSSWFGLIFNPLGYAIERNQTPPTELAQNFANQTPPTALVTANTSSAEFATAKGNWVQSCGSYVKSKDVGVTLSNANKVCAGVFDGYPGIEMLKAQSERYTDEKEATQQKATQKNIMIAMAFIMLFAGLLMIFKK